MDGGVKYPRTFCAQPTFCLFEKTCHARAEMRFWESFAIVFIRLPLLIPTGTGAGSRLHWLDIRYRYEPQGVLTLPKA